MAVNATPEHVAIVLHALAEEFLVDIPAVFDKDGVATIEYTVLANALLNSDKEWYSAIAEFINAPKED